MSTWSSFSSFFATFSVELLEELLAPLREIHLLFMLEQLVEDDHDGIERVIAQLHVIIIQPFSCFPSHML